LVLPSSNPATRRRRIRLLFAAATLAFWLSLLPYLPPITLTPELKDLVAQARETREYVPEMNRPAEELESSLVGALRILYFKWAVTILLGVLSGIILLAHPPAGRVLAIALSSLMLAMKAFSLISTYPRTGQLLYFIFFLALPRRPVYVIHNEIVAPLFWIATLVVLWRWPPKTTYHAVRIVER
jgi:hypothetical protein